MAYHQYDPIGSERFDYLFARLAYHITTALHPKASAELKLEDFMPRFGPETVEDEEVAAANFIEKVKAMNRRLGGSE